MLTALQQRFNDQSGVNIDTEMSNLIALQNAYGANARVMTTIQQMMATLLQAVHVMSITGPGSITAANVMAQTNMMNQLNTLSQELGTGQAAQTYSGSRSQAGAGAGAQRAALRLNGYSNTATTVGTTLSIAQSALTAARQRRQRVQQAHQSAGRVFARQHRPNFGAGIRGELSRSDLVAAQHPGRQQLHLLRQRGEPAVRRQRQRHSQRQRRAGRPHASDRRTPAGRSGPTGLAG